MNKLEQLRVGLFIGEEKMVDLTNRVEAAAAAKRNGMVGAWSADSGFAVAVLLSNGEPYHWHVQGPFTRDQAQAFFNVERADGERLNSTDVRH